MDVNKTVIMTDTVTGKSVSHIVNETLSNAGWGEEVDGEWVLRELDPAVCRPATELDGCMALISYAEWVNKSFPGSDNKKKRSSLNGTFTDPGHPGEKMKDHTAASMKALTMPDGSDVRILPGLFELMLWLKRERRSFSLCFRTFGEDLPDIAIELNSFCEGKHPLFPGACMDGSDGEPDYRFHVSDSDRFGTFHRDKHSVSLIMGTHDQPGEGPHKKVKDRSMAFYTSMADVRIYSGFEAVKAKLDVLQAVRGTLGLRDYFAYWKETNNTSEGGKMFFYNPVRATNQHELFFDDNIHFSDCHIVNPIDVSALDRKPWVTALLQTHLSRAEPLESIPDRWWFVKKVQQLETGYERKLCARDRLRKMMWRVLRRQKQGKILPLFMQLPDKHEFDAWERFRRNDRELSLCVEDDC